MLARWQDAHTSSMVDAADPARQQLISLHLSLHCEGRASPVFLAVQS